MNEWGGNHEPISAFHYKNKTNNLCFIKKCIGIRDKHENSKRDTIISTLIYYWH